MRKNRFLFSIMSVLLIAAMMLTGCGAKDAAAEKTAGEKNLVIAMPDEIEGTDIQQVMWENIVHRLLYEPLVAYDLELKDIIPNFAESYKVSEDGKEIEFKLPSDVKFSNGDALTAEDVKKSIERYKEISPYAEDLDPIKEVVVKDQQTVAFILETPAAYLWPNLTSVYGGVVSAKKAGEVSTDEFNRKAVGNGPFTVEEWTQGSQIVLAKNPAYISNNPIVENKGPAKLDKVTIRFISENFTRVSELESGNVDIIYGVPSESVEDLQNNSNIQMYKYLQGGLDYIALNANKKPLDDINVRTAIAMALDKDEISKGLKDTVVPRYGLISPAQVCYDEKTEQDIKNQLGYNVEKAKELLAQSGWKDENGDGIVEKDGNPLTITLMVALDSPAIKQSSPILQTQLKKAGINLELREYEMKYIKQMVKEKNFDMATRYFEWTDPDILYYIFSTDADSYWADKNVDKMLEDARYIMDSAQRTQKYAEVQKAITAQLPAIPLFSEYNYIAAKKSVTGFKIGVSGTAYINDVDKE